MKLNSKDLYIYVFLKYILNLKSSTPDWWMEMIKKSCRIVYKHLFNRYTKTPKTSRCSDRFEAKDILESTVADQRFLASNASYVRMRYVYRHRTGSRPTEPSNLDFEVNWYTLYFFFFCSTCMFFRVFIFLISLFHFVDWHWMSWAAPTSC